MAFPRNTMKVQRTSLRTQVENAMSAAIISGQLPPGELITVPTLAQQFEVSATPVREALLELAGRGLLEPVRNKGFRVTEVSTREMQNIAEVRMLLEPPAMRSLADTFDRDAEPELRELADRITRGAAEGDLETYLVCDLEFHERLTGMLGNPILTELVNDLRTRARLSHLEQLATTGMLVASAAEHHQLLDALLAGDVDTVEQVMQRHIRHTTGIWLGNDETAAGHSSVSPPTPREHE